MYGCKKKGLLYKGHKSCPLYISLLAENNLCCFVEILLYCTMIFFTVPLLYFTILIPLVGAFNSLPSIEYRKISLVLLEFLTWLIPVTSYSLMFLKLTIQLWRYFFFLSKKNKILSVRIMYMICRYPNPWKNQNFLSDHLHFVLDNKLNHPSLPSLRTYLSNCRIPQRRNNQHHEFLLVSESLSSCYNQRSNHNPMK